MSVVDSVGCGNGVGNVGAAIGTMLGAEGGIKDIEGGIEGCREEVATGAAEGREGAVANGEGASMGIGGGSAHDVVGTGARAAGVDTCFLEGLLSALCSPSGFGFYCHNSRETMRKVTCISHTL
jgi:hypothetical protein